MLKAAEVNGSDGAERGTGKTDGGCEAVLRVRRATSGLRTSSPVWFPSR